MPLNVWNKRWKTKNRIIYRNIWFQIPIKLCCPESPFDSPFEKSNCISKLVLCQRGTSAEQSRFADCIKGNIEARPPLIALHELKSYTLILKGEQKGD